MQGRRKKTENRDVRNKHKNEAIAHNRQERHQCEASHNNKARCLACWFDRALWLSDLTVLARNFFASKQTKRAENQNDDHHNKH